MLVLGVMGIWTIFPFETSSFFRVVEDARPFLLLFKAHAFPFAFSFALLVVVFRLRFG